jgi:hypothetical protein
MGIFDSYGINAEEVAEAGFVNLNAGNYAASITAAEVVQGSKNDANYVGLVITYTVDGTTDTVQERFGLPKSPRPWSQEPLFDDEGNLRTLRNGTPITEESNNLWLLGLLKTRLLALGVPEARINGINPQDLVGIPVALKLVKNGNYTNVAMGTEGAKFRPAMQQSLPQATSPVTPAPAFAPPQAPAAFNPSFGRPQQ